MVNKLFSPQLEYILSLFYLNHLCNETLLRIIWHARKTKSLMSIIMLIFVGISVECHIDYQEKSDRIMITLEVCKFEQHDISCDSQKTSQQIAYYCLMMTSRTVKYNILSVISFTACLRHHKLQIDQICCPFCKSKMKKQ